MNSFTVCTLLCAVIALLHIQSSSAISCYVCASSSISGSSNDPCGSGSNFNKNGPGVLNTTGCTSCLKTTSTVSSYTAYTRSCSLTSQASTGCVSVASVSSCVDACSTDFCNKAALTSGYTVLSLLSALLLSVKAAFF